MSAFRLLVGISIAAVASVTLPAKAYGQFAQVLNPVGIVTDGAGNVFVSHDQVASTVVSRFSPNGTLLNQIQIGGFIDLEALGSMARIPSSGTLLLLLNNGHLIAIDPATQQPTSVLNIRQLNVNTSAIYDVASGNVDGFGGLIQVAFSSFGDLAIHETPGRLDLFVTALSQAQTFPFVMRIRFEGGQLTDAQVLLSSRADAQARLPQNVRHTRGIAVNSAGAVLTTLPVAPPLPNGNPAFQPFDVPVAFSASFDPAQGNRPQFVLGQTDLYSQAMTTDNRGNFLVATNSVGSAALGPPEEAILVALSPGLDRILSVSSLGERLTHFRGVAVSPDNTAVYITVTNVSAGPSPGRVIASPMASIVSSDPEEAGPRRDLYLETPFPHPVSDRAIVRFTVPAGEQARLAVYDLLGRRVHILPDELSPARGVQEKVFETGDLAQGVYVIRLETDRGFVARPFVIAR